MTNNSRHTPLADLVDLFRREVDTTRPLAFRPVAKDAYLELLRTRAMLRPGQMPYPSMRRTAASQSPRGSTARQSPPNEVDTEALPSFRAINESFVEEARSESLDNDIEELLEALPTEDRPVQRWTEEDLEHKEFLVREITGRRVRSRVVMYRVFWEGAILPKRLVRSRDNGEKYVRCRAKEWTVLEAFEEAALDGEPMCVVGWEQTWEPATALIENASEAIEEFHEKTKAARDMRPPRSAKLMPSIESTGPRHSPDEDERSAPCLRPRAGVNYFPALKRILQEYHDLDRTRFTAPTLLLAWGRKTKRELTVRPVFADDDKVLDFKDRDRANAALVFTKGVEHESNPCDRCRKGLGPFSACVTLEGYAKGVCTNCVYMSARRYCSLHDGLTPRSKPTQHRSETHPSPTTSAEKVEIACSSDKSNNRHQSEQALERDDLLSSPASSASSDIGAALRSSLEPSFQPPGSSDLFLSPPTSPAPASSTPAPKPSGTVCQDITNRPSRKRFCDLSAQDQEEAKKAARLSKLPRHSTPHPIQRATLLMADALRRKSEGRLPLVAGQPVATWIESNGHMAGPASVQDRCGNSPSSPVIYSNRQFEPGEATLEEVNAVLDRCTPALRKAIDGGWEGWRAGKEASGVPCDDTMEFFLSTYCVGVLNLVVEACCPVPPPSMRLQLNKDNPIVIDD